jgi:hypothetical protein
MPIIKSTKNTKTEKVKLSIDSDVIKEVKQYCDWASVKNVNIFFEQAAEFVLNKDSEWKKHKKTRKSL